MPGAGGRGQAVEPPEVLPEHGGGHRPEVAPVPDGERQGVALVVPQGGGGFPGRPHVGEEVLDVLGQRAFGAPGEAETDDVRHGASLRWNRI
ncbi:hypothetical protein D3C87_1725400 [compost metagenome]